VPREHLPEANNQGNDEPTADWKESPVLLLRSESCRGCEWRWRILLCLTSPVAEAAQLSPAPDDEHAGLAGALRIDYAAVASELRIMGTSGMLDWIVQSTL